MAKGINKVILIGRLGQDPELKYMPNGDAVANFSIATSESWKDQRGQKQERTEWHRCTAYRKVAEIIGEYLRKGANIYIEGKLQTREWTDQQGQKRYTTEIIVNEMQMLDGRNGNAAPAGGQPASTRPAQQRPSAGAPAAGAAPTYSEPPMDFDDDIPFAPLFLQNPELAYAC